MAGSGSANVMKGASSTAMRQGSGSGAARRGTGSGTISPATVSVAAKPGETMPTILRGYSRPGRSYDSGAGPGFEMSWEMVFGRA